ncbi:MAG: phosphomannomutase/phosphoglucomutase [Gammaproteobacteria bacterium]|nr:phosphomannomutase/phosphoglucomutase [Gammaproteobacteria bacterium]
MDLSPDIFRAYDIRGLVHSALTPSVVRSIGHAVGVLYPDSPRVVVARDGRLSSAELATAVRQGLMSAGCSIIDIGEVPTPVLYYAAHVLGTGAGIMVTGSHNPPEYNGLKLVMDGKTLHGKDIQQIYQRILQGDMPLSQGQWEHMDLTQSYIERICEDVKLARTLRIAIDCGNGVAGPTAAALFRALGCDVRELHCQIDGHFPNHHPNPSIPSNLEDLITCVTAEGLALGLAFDGDGDRLGVVDEQGLIIWADRQMMLYAKDVLSRNPGAEIIYDVKSSRLLGDMIKRYGGRPLMWKTGHSFVKAKMKQTGALLAGEMSGHIFFKERWYGFDDGLYTAARLLEILSQDDRPSSEVFAELPNAISTPELNVHFDQDGAQHDYMLALVASAEFEGGQINDIDGLRVDYPDGWGLVRASNTTPSLVIRFEAENQSTLQKIQEIFRVQLLKVDPSLRLPF